MCKWITQLFCWIALPILYLTNWRGIRTENSSVDKEGIREFMIRIFVGEKELKIKELRKEARFFGSERET